VEHVRRQQRRGAAKKRVGGVGAPPPPPPPNLAGRTHHLPSPSRLPLRPAPNPTQPNLATAALAAGRRDIELDRRRASVGGCALGQWRAADLYPAAPHDLPAANPAIAVSTTTTAGASPPPSSDLPPGPAARPSQAAGVGQSAAAGASAGGAVPTEPKPGAASSAGVAGAAASTAGGKVGAASLAGAAGAAASTAVNGVRGCAPCLEKRLAAGAVSGLSAYTRSLMDRPMSTWFFGPVEALPSCGQAALRSESGARTAGQETVPLGQVPKSPEARLRDMATLNRYIREVWQTALKAGLIPRNQPAPRQLGPEDVKIILAEFFLGSDSRCTTIKPDCLSTLFPPPHLAHLPRRKSDRAGASPSGNSTGAPGRESGGPWPGLVGSTSPVCMNISKSQEDRRIYLRVYDLLTAFPDRWLDSVVIDAYIHLLQEHCQFKDSLYVNSAENDPSLAEISRTPPCYKYIICPLFYRSHWTVLFISHPSKRIRYLNSQVVDRSTPEFQTRPFAELFPGYSVKMLTPTKQCDQSSCGVIVCLWSHIFLYFDEEEMDRIKCPDINPCRDMVLKQLILSYIILNRSLQQ
jgi:hypothetical protein